MQRLHTSIIILVLIFFAAIPARAQQTNQEHSKKWIPGKGYWVIESNIHTPATNTVYFYTDNDLLIHTEKIEGRKLNIRRKATLKKLYIMLNNSLLALDKISNAKKDASLVETNVEIRKK